MSKATSLLQLYSAFSLCVFALSVAADTNSTESEGCAKGFTCFTNWYKSGQWVTTSWVLVFLGSPYAIISLILLLLGLLELINVAAAPHCLKSYFYPNVVVLCLWPAIVGLAIYLVVGHVLVALVFVILGAVCMVLHVVLLVSYWKTLSKAKNQENPRQQLLTAQKPSHKRGSEPADTTEPADVDAPAQNPFASAYGLIPGTSQYAYQIFIPTDPDLEYSGLPSKSPALRKDQNKKDKKERTLSP